MKSGEETPTTKTDGSFQPAVHQTTTGVRPEENETRRANIEIVRPGETSPRYTISIVDPESSISDDQIKFVAFVIPLGKEEDWIFCSEEGRQILRRNCHVDRMALISMHRGHEYPDFVGVKRELEDTILGLAPQALRDRNEKVKFLTRSATLKVDQRNVLRKEQLKTGECMVEEVMQNGERYRRLIFMNDGQAVQSEVKLKKNDANEVINEVDLNHVSWDQHILMNVSISLALAQRQKSRYDVLLLGLGGGVMTSLIHKYFENVWITAVEVEEIVYKLAKEYFGLKQDERIKVHIEDGLKFLTEAAKKGMKYDAIVIDVDGADPREAMSCPPIAFLDPRVLNDILSCLNEKGLLLVNFVCRSLKLKTEMFARLRTIFAGVVVLESREHVNETVIAWTGDVRITQEDIEKATREFYACSKKRNLVVHDDVENICQLLETINM